MTTAQSILTAYLLEHPQHNQFAAAINLELAERAFHAQSFNPERRGAMVIVDYAQRCERFLSDLEAKILAAKSNGAKLVNDGDYKNFLEEQFTDFQTIIAQCFTDYIHAESSCMSSMVTGPARFPVEKNRKRMNSAHNKYEAISAKEKSLMKRALKIILPDGDGMTIKSDAGNAREQLESKIEALKKEQVQRKAINAMVRTVYPKGCLKSGATESDITQLIEKLILTFDLDKTAAKNLLNPDRSYGRVIPYADFTLRNRNQEIKRYESRLVEQKRLDEERSSCEFGATLENGVKYELSEDNKIVIHFGFKPDDETRKILKANAFKFSRYRDSAWVRKHTLNAQYAFEKSVLPIIKELAE